MKILWHSNHPDDKTGFGRQTALWVPAIASLGHEVAVSAFHGVAGRITDWQGHRVYPGGDDPWGMDVIGGHYRHFGADLMITLQDMWPCDPAGFVGLKVAHWVPVDCHPLAAGDRRVLQASGGRAIAMSRFGEEQLRDAGFDPLYVPHGIDTTVFTPMMAQGKYLLQGQMKIRGKFVVGINAANQDKQRKSYDQQFQAFARFRGKHDDVVLLVHTRAENSAVDGLNLYALAAACGLEAGKDVFFCDQYAYQNGLIGDEAMANWYRILDVLSMPSRAEGFGLPLLEAQACGVPVITTRAAPMIELCASGGWLADGEDFWNWRHEAWWKTPAVTKIAQCYEQAYKEASRLSGIAREFAEQYDVKKVLAEHWEPALAALATTCPPQPAPPDTTSSPAAP